MQTFEDTVSVQVPSALLARKRNDLSVYWKSLPLRPGLYKIDIVIKDVNNPDHIGRGQRSLNVPRYDDDRLASSSLIFATTMERVPTRDNGAGSFFICGKLINTLETPTIPARVPYQRRADF